MGRACATLQRRFGFAILSFVSRMVTCRSLWSSSARTCSGTSYFEFAYVIAMIFCVGMDVVVRLNFEWVGSVTVVLLLLHDCTVSVRF